MEEQSVKNLKSRFEQLNATAKPPLPVKPVAHRQVLAGLHKPSPGAQVQPDDAVARTNDLPRTGGPIDMDMADPFGSPLNSPALEKDDFKPRLPGNKPKQVVSDTMPRRFSAEVSQLHDPQPSRSVLLTVPGVSTATVASISRPGSTKPAPPPPSPRLKSPRPMNRTSGEMRRLSPAVARNIFDDVEDDGDENSLGTDLDDRLRGSNKSRNVSETRVTHPRSSMQNSSSTEHDVVSEQSVRNRAHDVSTTQSFVEEIPRSLSMSPDKLNNVGHHGRPQPNRITEGHAPVYEITEERPALPVRPVSQSFHGREGLHSEMSSIIATRQKPDLPRRTDTANTMPPPNLVRSMPPLPSRTMVSDPSKHTNPASRQSLQHERRSMDSPASYRRSLDESSALRKPQKSQNSEAFDEDSDADDDPPMIAENTRALDQPDTSTANRKAPRFKGTHWDISTGKEIRKTALCGDSIMIAHSEKLKLHNILTGEVTWQLPVVDTRVTAMDFRTVNASELENAGRFLWIGFRDGSLHELDIKNRVIVERYFHAHSGPIVAILRNKRSMWTLDDNGNLQIWSNTESCSLKGRPASTSLRTVIGISAATVINGVLWIGSGRTVHVFDPSKTNQYRLTPDRGIEPNRVAGIITCVIHLPHTPDCVYFGHDDGKISIYSVTELKCIEVISISHYNLSGLLGVGDYLWASFKTGKIFVYDVHSRPWRVMKEWHAHKSPILELNFDRYGLWQEKRLQVSSMAGDGAVKIWDGLLMEDWLDSEMQRRLEEFSTMTATSALVCTWNAGAAVPQKLTRDYEDAQFIENMIRQARSPDFIVFGFQELVDLDDKGKAGKSVAKGFFGKKKEKEPDEKAQAAAYQQWQAHLEKQVAIASSSTDDYKLLQVRSLVGLFTCMFVKRKIQNRISNVEASSVKTGLKGRYGNKGAIVIRMIFDDTSMCFINCHLAAGQKNVMNRNNDIFSILDQAGLSASSDRQPKNHVFVSGGDGSMVLDHEICIINGDLNYRINGNRNQVIQNVKEGRLEKLLESDQLLLELRKNATHRMRSFTESAINFNPTYKYDPGTDNYDSSEKMRVPAWCDRIYYRGLGASKLHTSTYQAHVCRVSDHRPVSALLHMRVSDHLVNSLLKSRLTMHKVKTVDAEQRKQVYDDVTQQWIDLANKTIVAKKIAALCEVTGRNERECKEMLRKTHGQVVSDAARAMLST